jgi:hypothetical protein
MVSIIPNKIMCSYICNNVDELNFQNRKNVLQIIYNSPSQKKITEKGNGSQIKMDDLPIMLIITIYDFIKKKLETQITEFNLEI